MSDDAAATGSTPAADRPSETAPPPPPLPWPPPGLERLRADLWDVSTRLVVGAVVFVLPMLAAVTLPQDPWGPGIFGDAWWKLLVTALAGGWVLTVAFIRLVRVLSRWRAAERRGYRPRTVALVLADQQGDTGYLVQGAREYSLIPAEQRKLLVTGRLAQAGLALAAGLWLSVGFTLGVMGAARGLLGEAGLTFWTLVPPLAIGAAILLLRAAENTLVVKARRAWHAKPWSEDLARDEIQAWHTAVGERELALPVPIGTLGYGGARQRAAAVAVGVLGLMVLLLAVPLVTVAGIGPVLTAIAIPKFSATSEKAGRMEAFAALRPPVDPSITLSETEEAFRSLMQPSGPEGIMRSYDEPDDAPLIPREDWENNPTGMEPWFWARDLVPRLADGLEPEVVRYLQDLGANPAFEVYGRLARAPALDEAGALYNIPFPEELDIWQLPIPKFSRSRELAYMQVGAAVGDAAVGDLAAAEARLRDLIGAGLLWGREGNMLISNLIGIVVAGVGGDALLNLYEATGQTEKAAELRERVRAVETAMERAGVGRGSLETAQLLDVVADTAAIRGLRWEFFRLVNAIGPCINIQRAVFGPPDDFEPWVDEVRASLVRYPGEEEILQLMLRGWTPEFAEPSGLLSAARLYAQVMGGGVGSCAELAAAAAMF